jgi:hypothetical protein
MLSFSLKRGKMRKLRARNPNVVWMTNPAGSPAPIENSQMWSLEKSVDPRRASLARDKVNGSFMLKDHSRIT